MHEDLIHDWNVSGDERPPETLMLDDETLRDGLQVEGVSATVDDKLRIATQLYRLGVQYIEGGTYPEVYAYKVNMSCNHCAEPACLPACPTGAIWKRKQDGIVDIGFVEGIAEVFSDGFEIGNTSRWSGSSP